MAVAKKLPPISVIVPVLNEENYLERAVNSVLSQPYPNEIELLLALGPSTDKTNEVAARLAAADKRIKLIENTWGLTTVGLNQCIRASKHNIVIRIDAHSQPTKNYFKRGVEILLEQKAALVGGIMDARGSHPFQRAVAWAYKSKFGLGGPNFHSGGEAGESESAYLGIFDKKQLLAVNGYDEGIVRGEDWDLAQRIKRNGGLVWFSPELRVIYWPRARFKLLVRQFYTTGVWRGDLTRRGTHKTSYRYFAAPLLVFMCIIGLMVYVSDHRSGLIPLLAYTAALATIVVTARGVNLLDRVALFVVIPTMHFAWGWGFLVGVIRGAQKTFDSKVHRGLDLKQVNKNGK